MWQRKMEKRESLETCLKKRGGGSQAGLAPNWPVLITKIQHGRRCTAGLRLGSGTLAQPPLFVHLSHDFCVWVVFRSYLIRSTCSHTYTGRCLTNACCRSTYHQQAQECNYGANPDTNHYRRASTTNAISASTDAGQEWRCSASIGPFGAS